MSYRSLEFRRQSRTMSLIQDDIMQVVKVLAEEEDLQVVVKKTTTGAVIGLVSTAAGMLLAGIPGLVIGAAVGSVLGYRMSEGSKGLTDVLSELRPEVKAKLYNGIIQLLKDLARLALEILLEYLFGDLNLKNKIIEFIKSFFKNTLNMKVKYKS